MKIMKKNLIYFLLALFVITTGCQKDETDPVGPIDVIELLNMTIVNDPALLNQRLDLRNEVVTMRPEYLNPLKSAGQNDIDLKSNFVFTLQADVNAPVYGGKSLMATHVAVKDDYAFVSYNMRGNDYGGGVEIFNVADVSNPLIVSLAVFLRADINAIDFKDGKIFAVGAMEEFEELGFESPAFLQVLNVSPSMLITGSDTVIDLPSFSANGIRVADGRIYATSGDAGGLTVFDLDYNHLQETTISDARSVDTNTDHIFVLSGQPGKISAFDIFTGTILNEYTIGGANTPHSKSEISVNDEYVFAALNEEGVRMLTTDGTIKQHIPKPATPPGELDENHVTNSVSLNGSLLFMGNGHSGIAVAEMIPAQDDELQILGTMIFDDMQSTNFVRSADNVVFVASGLGGLKILSIGEDDGTPDDIIITEPCPTLVSAISEFLPEYQDATVHIPELFDPANTLNVTLAEESPVYVVFIDEGAGWKNTLGYYAYPANNPPTSVEDLEKYVIFPNVSIEGGGGGLTPGDMVQLGDGAFPANTVVGFYLVAQGWGSGQLVDGLYTHYTNIELNPSNFQQHVLFIENGCQDLVLAFEDRRITGGDKDYNDVIIAIKDNEDDLPNTKFDVDGIVQMNVVDDNDDDK